MELKEWVEKWEEEVPPKWATVSKELSITGMKYGPKTFKHDAFPLDAPTQSTAQGMAG